MCTFESCTEMIRNTRRPKTLVRGRTLTQEELYTLVINEEPFFKCWDKCGKDLTGERWVYDEHGNEVVTDVYRGYCGTLRNIVHRNGFEWLDGWLFEDGTIYGSYYEVKYPEYNEYADKFVELAKRNSFVDMVVAVTDMNENICYNCSLLGEDEYRQVPACNCNCILKDNNALRDYIKNSIPRNRIGCIDAKSLFEETGHDYFMTMFFSGMDTWLEPFDMYRNVKVLLHIHDGIVETLWGEEAQNLYKQYDSMYGDFRMAISNNPYFFNAKSMYGFDDIKSHVRFSDSFMRNCFERIRLDRNHWDDIIVPEYIVKSGLEKFVVSKEWLLQEYDRHFNNTGLDIRKINEYTAEHNEYIKKRL